MNKKLKALIEKRDLKITEMESITKKLGEEVRGFSAEEKTTYDAAKEEVRGLNEAIEALKEARAEEIDEAEEKRAEAKKETDEERAEAAAAKELKDIFNGNIQTEQRADSMNTGTPAQGGIVVNKQLVGEIIKKLKDRSNVMGFFDSTSLNGVCKIPKKASSGAATWEDEQLAPNSNSKSTVPTLEILELSQYRLYRESAITQQMLNFEEIDLKSFITDDISETMGDTLEDSIFNGDGSKKPTGLLSGIKAANKVTLATRGVVSADDIKRCKAKLKKAAQKGARWFMHADTFLEVSLLKDGEGRYLIQPDIKMADEYMLLGLPVEVTDAMPTPADAGAKALIVLANPKAYHINIPKNMAMYIYDDSTFKRAGLIGYGCDMFIDGKVKDDQLLAAVFNKA